MLLVTAFPGQKIPYGLMSYKGGFKTGTKQQHIFSFDKHFQRNLSKDHISELENNSKQNEVVNDLLMSFWKTMPVAEKNTD